MKRKVMFLIAICVVCVIAFSTATYAAFTLQYNPEVSGLNFAAKTQEYMMISKNGEVDTFEDVISFNELSSGDVVLKPLEGRVVENQSISLYKDGNVATDNFIKFSLYFTSSNDMDLYLAGSNQYGVINAIVGENGLDHPNDIEKLKDSLRVGFVSYSLNENYNGTTNLEKYVPSATNIYSYNAKDASDYNCGGNIPYVTFNRFGYTGGTLWEDTVILSTTYGEISKLDVYIWLEEKDVNSNVEIFDTTLEVNLRFQAVSTEEAIV